VSASIAIDIADAIVATLNANGGSWPMPFTAVRTFSPTLKLDALATLTVEAIPAGIENGDSSTRGSFEEIVETSIGVRQLVNISDASAVAAVIGVGEAIRSYLTRRVLVGSDAAFYSIEQVHLFIPNDLSEKHTVASFVTVKHRNRRAFPA